MMNKINKFIGRSESLFHSHNSMMPARRAGVARQVLPSLGL